MSEPTILHIIGTIGIVLGVLWLLVIGTISIVLIVLGVLWLFFIGNPSNRHRR